jgi:hypothetical protein
MWIAQVEAQFTLAGMSSEQTKFYYVISQLDHQSAAEVEDIITSPLERDHYTTVKTELVTRLSPSREQRIRQFLIHEMGDRKPSQFLRQLRSLIPDDFLHSIWSSRLPPNVRAILAVQPEGDLDAAARCANRIIEAAPYPALPSVAPFPNSSALTQRIKDISRQVAALSTKLTNLRSNYRDPRPSSRNRRSDSRSPSRDNVTPTLC